jgi:hypothetical protein
MEKVVLCGANGYEGKYYLNPVFNKIPESIKKELNIICVLFTEEVGGIITIGFDEEGELEITTQASDDDYMYDEIASGLLVSKIRATRQDLFESLNLFYRVIVLGEDIASVEED